MPSPHPVLVALRGTDQYARYLELLERAVRKAGVALDQVGAGGGPTALVELALAELGARHGLMAPARIGRPGANQHGPPPAPKKIPGGG
jgi:hypothetical protein